MAPPSVSTSLMSSAVPSVSAAASLVSVPPMSVSVSTASVATTSKTGNFQGKVKCLICHREFKQRGLNSHMRRMHPLDSRPSIDTDVDDSQMNDTTKQMI